MIGRILPVVLFIITLGLFFGYINPTYTQKVLPLEAQIKQYDQTLAAAADFNKKEAQLATDRSAISADAIHRLETYLPDGVDNVQLILDLNALAARSGVQLSNFDIKGDILPPAAGGDQSNSTLPLSAGNKSVDSVELSVKAVGTYSSFRTFLAGVEQSLRPLDLVEIDVAPTPTGVYAYDMTFRIYWLH